MKQGKLLTGLRLWQSTHTQSYTYTYSTHTYNCHISQLFHEQLSALYPQPTLTQLVLEFSKYMCLPAEMLGKKSSGILVSANRKFCVKMLDEDSFGKLRSSMGEVLAYVGGQGGQGGQGATTGLVEIFRVFVIESRKEQYEQIDAFVVMPCLRSNFEDVIAIYDIKGHTDTRNLDPEDFQVFKFGKDQNFISSPTLSLLKQAPKPKLAHFLSTLQKDSNFLKNLNIIDYSLLLNFRRKNNSPYRNCIALSQDIEMEWAIIDYFQEFNHKKKAENKFKMIFKKEVSSVEPNIYAERFVGFMEKCLGL